MFRNVFLTDGGVHGKLLSAKAIALNLIQLVSRCSEGEVTSVEKILGEMFRRKELEVSDAIIATLWNTVWDHFIVLLVDSHALAGGGAQCRCYW